MSSSREAHRKATIVTITESWWNEKSKVEKRLLAGTALLAGTVVVLLGLFLYGFRHGGSAAGSTVSGLAGEVCNTTACKKMASLILASVDENVDPCEDFYQFTCGNWQRRHPIPDDLLQYSNSDIVKLQLRQDLRDILEKAPYKTKRQNITDKVVMAYHACTKDLSNLTQSDEPQARTLKHLFASLGIPVWPLRAATQGSNDLNYSFFSKLYVRTGLSPIFRIVVSPAAKNVTDYVFHIAQPVLGLRRYQLLNPTNSDNQVVVEAYKAFISECIRVLDPHIEQEDLKSAADSIFYFEVELAKRARPREERHRDISGGNMKSIAQLQREAPGVDWLQLINAVLNNANITVGNDETIVVRDLAYVTSTAEFLRKADTATIYNYMVWHVVQELAHLTTRKFRHLKSTFTLAAWGVSDNLPTWQKCITTLNNLAGNALGRLYVQQKFPARAKEGVNRLVAELREALALILEQNQWMDASSKQGALTKLKVMIPQIGYPDWLTDDAYLGKLHAWVDEVSPGASFLEIYLNLVRGHVLSTLRRLHTFYDGSTEWSVSPAAENGFYDPTANVIRFPAGLLQIPFYSNDLPINVNMAIIGTIIGHEVTHAFLGSGSSYDGKGNRHNSWTQEPRTELQRRVQCLVDKYRRAVGPGANTTLNEINPEDIVADDGGIRQAFRAQRVAIAKTGAVTAPAMPSLERYTSDQVFFISAAQAWCASARTKDTKNNARYGTHSPNKHRVNTVIGNIDKFSEAFHCAEGSPMNPKDKCAIW